MTKLVSISGLVFIVKDLDRTKEFYEKLGFLVANRESDRLTIRLNWFWVDFVTVSREDNVEIQKEAALSNRGAGEWLCISVDDVDDFHAEVIKKGLKPDGMPDDRPVGRREFILRDPDGYKLVFFQKIK